MKGKIMKGISGFYYVHVAGSGIYECRAKGVFRKQKVKPLVGDDVEITVLDEDEKEGSIISIDRRKNELLRPAVANIDQALLIFAVKDPAPNYNLLDRLLIMVHLQSIPAVICFNKSDYLGQGEREKIEAVYKSCGAPVVFTSVKEASGLDALLLQLKGKTSAAFGPSGVGKSSLTNALQTEVRMEIGEISRKIGRGKNTTRHSQLIRIEGDAYLMDTPGFGSLDVLGLTAENLWAQYEEFLPYEPFCRFGGCSHINEPDCAVKQALGEGKIPYERYQSYVDIYEELKEKQKHEWRKL